MINDDVAPAVITKIRLAVTIVVNSGRHVRGVDPVVFLNYRDFRHEFPTSFPARDHEQEKESVKWKLRPAGDNGIGHDSVAAMRETIY